VESKTCIDFEITHPATPFFRNWQQVKIWRRRIGGPARQITELNDSYYNRHGYRFQPFRMKTFGALTKMARKLIQQLVAYFAGLGYLFFAQEEATLLPQENDRSPAHFSVKQPNSPLPFSGGLIFTPLGFWPGNLQS